MISQSEKSCSQTMKSLCWCFLVAVAVTVTSAALLNDARVERDASSTTPGLSLRTHQQDMPTFILPVNARVERDASSTTPGLSLRTQQEDMPFNARVERDSSSTTPGLSLRTHQDMPFNARVERDASSTTPGLSLRTHQDMPFNARVERDASSTTPGLSLRTQQEDMPFNARVERDSSSTTPGLSLRTHQDMPVNARVERDASSTTPGLSLRTHQDTPFNARVERDASSTTPGFPFKTDQRVAMKRARRSTIFPIDGIVERVAIFPVHEKTKRVVRESSEEDDSCKKMKPEHGAKMCCELPSVFRGSPDIFKACREELGLPDHKPFPPAPSAEGNGKTPHHGGPPHHRGKGCIAECLFNKTGLLENGKLNKEALQKSLDEYLKTDDAWKAVATSTLEKCYDSVQTKDFKPDNEKFASGSSEFMRCFSRGLFMDCIPSKWTDSDECSKTKETLEKCPKMLPPGVFNKGHH